MLSDFVLLRAGHLLYCCEYADVFESHGGKLPQMANLEQAVDPASAVDLLPLMRAYEAKLANAWGRPVEDVGLLMDMGDDKGLIDLVYYSLMACWGQGVGLEDDYSANLAAYKAKTGNPLDPSPISVDFRDLSSLALANLKTPDPEYRIEYADGSGTLEAKFHTQEAAEAWLRDRAEDASGRFEIVCLMEVRVSHARQLPFRGGFYFVTVEKGLEPSVSGKFLGENARDEAVRDAHRDTSDDDSLFWLDIADDGTPTIGTYAGGFFPQEESND